MKIYVASSWRNALQPAVVEALKAAGHDVYDFRNPEPGVLGFSWSEIDPGWMAWNVERFRMGLMDPIALAGFGRDMEALRDCEACVLVMPCGRSAHLELGYAIGAGKRTIILIPGDKPVEPELMYKMADTIVGTIEELLEALRRVPA